MSPELLVASNGSLQKANKNSYQGKPVIETLTNGYFIVDQNWTVKSWNKSAEKLLGVAQVNIVGKNLWEEFAHLVPVEFYAVYNKAFLGDIPIQFHEYWAEKNAWFDVTTWFTGDKLYVSFKNSSGPYSEEQGTLLERLNTLAELYKYVTEITNDSLWEWDWRTNEIFWIDGGHKRAFGYPIENKLVPVNFWKSCIHPEDKQRVWTKLYTIINNTTDCIWEDEYRFKRMDGSYCYVHDRGHILRTENNAATRIIGATQDINERVVLQQQLALQQAAQQREITSAVLTGMENERASIGREIHDNLSQVMVVAKMYMQMAKDTEANRDAHIDRSVVLIQEVIDVIRTISKNLIVPPANIFGLSNNIKILVADVMAAHNIQIEFHEHSMEEQLPEELQFNIFRIVQEQMNNILRHSGATRASIRLSWLDNEVLLVIADNGKGADAVNEKKGVGIINIKSRVELLHGTLAIHSKPGKGYKLEAIFPLPGSKLSQ
jgi:PAS domain S-box-containing protein